MTITSAPEADGIVGLAGFRGPPDARGMVEVGRRIEPRGGERTHRA